MEGRTEESVSIETIQEFIRDLLDERESLMNEKASDFRDGIVFEINEILTRCKASLCGFDGISQMEEMSSIY